MNSVKNVVRPINSNKKKLNNEIILIFHYNQTHTLLNIYIYIYKRSASLLVQCLLTHI